MVVSGWIVEQSTNSLPFKPDFRQVSTVSSMALSSPTQVKMMSEGSIASSMVFATLVLPSGSDEASFSARAVVRLKMMIGLS